MTAASVLLREPTSQCVAEVLVGFGFNCYRFQARPQGEPIEIIWAEEGFAQGTKRPSGSGVPILFPFPGRIRGTRFVWEGREFTLPEGDGLGNAIHGFVHALPWRVLDQSATHVVGQFHASRDAPTLRNQWPADFRVTASYRLEPNRLDCHYLVENPDDHPLPFGFGTHPYFRVPLGSSGNADHCRVQLPVSSSWELVDMNATGKVQPLENAPALQAGMPFGDMQFDNVFGDLVFEEGRCRSTIRDPETGRAVEMSFDRAFRECVVYNPPHREAVCVEPYSCVPDCFRLQAEGVDAGLNVLDPGQAWEARIRISVE